MVPAAMARRDRSIPGWRVACFRLGGTNSSLADANEPDASAVRRDGDRIRLSGALRMRDAAAIWQGLRDAARDVSPGAEIRMDLSAVPAVDGGVMALLAQARFEMNTRGAHAELANMSETVANIAGLYDVERTPARAPGRAAESAVAQLGGATLAGIGRVAEFLGFLGSLVLTGVRRKRRPRAGRWRQIASLVEKTGAGAMPIVFGVLFVVGFIFAYSTPDQLIKIGQRLLSAGMIGRGMAREVAPVLTAFILAGRSGAAFTAELGTMKIDHEIDALRTLGLDPYRWLVVPRMMAMVIVMPALVIAGDFFGFAGGALVGVTTLGLRLPVYVHTLHTSISAWDIEAGIIKSAALGLMIAIVSCQQGISASGGPEDVGRRTTSAVVACLFFAVVIDAILTIIYESFGG
jgi:phospholipid/cholesterol/gamma-HCH transport system permease protein